MSANNGDSSSSYDSDSQFGGDAMGGKRYPVHDCCEFEGAPKLRSIIYVRRGYDSDSSGSDSESEKNCNGISDNKPKRVAKAPEYYCPFDLNERDEDENTPIHIAIQNRKLDCVKELLDANVMINKKCDGSSPVHVALSVGSIPEHSKFAEDCLNLLTVHSADLSERDDSLFTPLYLACAYNLPNCVKIILSDQNGSQTLNAKADRIGGRALHACARFGRSFGQSLDSIAKFLIDAGAHVDCANFYGRTPLHLAAASGNWSVARLLLSSGASPNLTDKKGETAATIAHKRGLVPPADISQLRIPGVIPIRDTLLDPPSKTILLCHELCSKHYSCPPIYRGGPDPPPENIRRLEVLINSETGILNSKEFCSCVWETNARRASMADVLKVHEYSYVEKISRICNALPDHPQASFPLDPDTVISKWSFESAMRAAGSVCEAVDKVMSGDFRNAFCAIRPPGHHAGPRGIVSCLNDPEGSHGFCLLNNVAIGAAYARTMYRNDGIKKIAIIDFDVHHGNGTEEIIRNLTPQVETATIETPFASGKIATTRYRPWLDETDVDDVFFASVHGYGARELRPENVPQCGWFYPASGKSCTSAALSEPNSIEKPNVNEFILTQTWARMGMEAQSNCCKIVNVGLELPRPNDIPGMQRIQLRDAYRKKVLPFLYDFDPDIIFISAGFDGHAKDTMNFGYVGMIEDDYEWLTSQLIRVANTCCHGRIVSVLEGGYKIHGGIVSPFARSVGSHVRALLDGGTSREQWDPQDLEWESNYEHTMIAEREKRRVMKQLESSSRKRHRDTTPSSTPVHDGYRDNEKTVKEAILNGKVLYFFICTYYKITLVFNLYHS
uniref:Histone deacetylase domain-containing protein n=2 Tax=Corethron hystrix TaxID=216773 RepID=A0A7S1B8M9_9STRA|mmetsp:Transcript_16804/g.37791  ORF Transcript_16804/g.37791 Transcript_16804/m.37791 type:complete len:841 (+) Transcript_16804:430-2952(+)